MKRIPVQIILLSLTLRLATLMLQGSPAEYTTNLKLTRSIATELWNAMDADQKPLFPRNCLVVAEDARPWVKPVEIRGSTVAGRYVAVSHGFVDLVNNVSHAKAIDQYEPGFFQRYLNQLAFESGRFPMEPVPDVSHPKYSTTEILNAQKSNFNQMVAMVIAIQLSHHELGHYDKHQATLEDPKNPHAINELLRGPEWNDAFQAGLDLALRAGYGVKGFEALCEALDKMPRHPAWTRYFLPPRINIAQLENEMERSEREFFNLSTE